MHWLEEHYKCKTPSEINDIISIKLPSLTDDLDGYKAVTDYMLHGPCGKNARNTTYTSDGKCSKHFPKPFLAKTFLDEEGYPHYRRRDNKLSFHLPNQNAITLRDSKRLLALLEKEGKIWKPRKQRKCIGRTVYSSPDFGERYYIRMLLNVVRGVEGFQQLMTVNKRLCATFKEACFAYGLLNDDKEWKHALSEANLWALGPQLRDIFVTMLLFRDGNMIHCTAKSNVAHNFLRPKEGGIYSVKNFVVLPNKDEFWIFKPHMFMLEFDGETTARKVSADPHDYLRYPFQMMDFDKIELANNKYLIGQLTRNQAPRHLIFTWRTRVLLSQPRRSWQLIVPYLRNGHWKISSYRPATAKSIQQPSIVRNVDYPVFRYKLEVVVVDDTTHTRTMRERRKMIKLTHSYKESHWINPSESAKDAASSSTPALTTDDAAQPMKRLARHLTVCTPSKPNEEKKKGPKLEDSDVDEVCGPADKKKKRKRYIEDDSESA
nr:hypothetical protein CTI12_AA222900 [Tanacetum cinerariifolium]